MTQEALYALLVSTGLPFAYGRWGTPPEPPYGVYLFTNSADIMADGVNYQEVSDWQVELYSSNKDPASETLVEEALRGARIPWEKFESYMDTEDLNQVVYTIRTI